MDLKKRPTPWIDYRAVLAIGLVVLMFYVVITALHQRDDALNNSKALSTSLTNATNEIDTLAQQLRDAGIKPHINPTPRPSSQGSPASVAPQPSFSPRPQPSPHPTQSPTPHPTPSPTHTHTRSPSPRPTPSPSGLLHQICEQTKICLKAMVVGWVWW